ncbi:unnamed protein product [Prorocentrum cordatum]|uniref:Uncharacterized protein n=1 Tax=Prorocentrum cordatum TaxID=2364126 RepID=A0ABN9XFH5_9DINO|nr:unnamed protein product [Polarella glacialis]
MGKAYNLLAARIRLLEKQTYCELDSYLQHSAIRRHAFLCEVLQHNVHHPSHAATLARPMVGDQVYRSSRRLFRNAGKERHVVFEQEARTPLSSDGVICARRWRRTRLRADAPEFLPSASDVPPVCAIAAYRSEPVRHTRSGSGLDMAGIERLSWSGATENDSSDYSGMIDCSEPSVLPPYVPSVLNDSVSEFLCPVVHELCALCYTHDQLLRAIEHKNEKIFDMQVLTGALATSVSDSDLAALALRVESLENTIDEQINAVRDDVTTSQATHCEKIEEWMCKVPRLDEFSAQLDALRLSLSTHQSETVTRVRTLVQDGAEAQRAYLENAVATVQRCVVDPAPATVSRWVEQPLSALWDDCQQLIDKHVSQTNEFLSATREGILMEAHVLLSNVSADIAVLRDSAVFVQKYKTECAESSMLRCSVNHICEELAALASAIEKVAFHDEAIHEQRAASAGQEEAMQQMAGLLSEMVARSPSQIANCVAKTMTSFIESDLIETRIRLVLSMLGRDGTRAVPAPLPAAGGPGSGSHQLRRASSDSDSDGAGHLFDDNGSLDRSWVDIDGARWSP